MQVVEMGTRAENLTGRKPVVIARAGNLDWYLVERVSDGRRFLMVRPGLNKPEAVRHAEARVA